MPISYMFYTHPLLLSLLWMLFLSGALPVMWCCWCSPHLNFTSDTNVINEDAIIRDRSNESYFWVVSLTSKFYRVCSKHAIISRGLPSFFFETDIFRQIIWNLLLKYKINHIFSFKMPSYSFHCIRKLGVKCFRTTPFSAACIGAEFCFEKIYIYIPYILTCIFFQFFMQTSACFKFASFYTYTYLKSVLKKYYTSMYIITRHFFYTDQWL